MKAFLNRINRGLSKEKDKEKELKEKLPQLPRLPDWPPQRGTPTPTTAYKPLPEISSRPLPPPDEPTSSSTESSAHPTPTGSITPLPQDGKEILQVVEVTVTATSPRVVEADSTGRNSRKTNNSSNSSNGAHADVQKKVAFLSPPPTPGPDNNRPLPSSSTPTPGNGGPSKTSVSRFQAAHTKDTRGSTSTAASSRTDIASTMKSVKPASTRAASSPYPRAYGDGASIHQSLRSGTPYSHMTNASSRILSAQSWSEGAEEDLVSNIGQRERTRQEVLWEIVASEERYVFRLNTRRPFLSFLQLCR